MQFMWKLWADVWDLMDFISAQSQASCGDMCDCIAYMQERIMLTLFHVSTSVIGLAGRICFQVVCLYVVV